jgi:hypothetical protein
VEALGCAAVAVAVAVSCDNVVVDLLWYGM